MRIQRLKSLPADVPHAVEYSPDRGVQLEVGVWLPDGLDDDRLVGHLHAAVGCNIRKLVVLY